jgi:hypothetical protein
MLQTSDSIFSFTLNVTIKLYNFLATKCEYQKDYNFIPHKSNTLKMTPSHLRGNARATLLVAKRIVLVDNVHAKKVLKNYMAM